MYSNEIIVHYDYIHKPYFSPVHILRPMKKGKVSKAVAI